jgi:hypothetical protein
VTNCTQPDVPPPSGGGENQTINVTNCTFYKACRERPRCASDKDWWSYWSGYEGKCGCHSCGCKEKKAIRKRVCNATADESFDVDEFLSNSTYYADCDCVVFQNCTNTTIIVPPVIPIPPLPPSGGGECNYTCEDFRTLVDAVRNLTAIIVEQQNDIDMLVAQYQQIVQNGGSGSGSDCTNCTAQFSAINSEIDQLYEAVNKVTSDSTAATLDKIRSSGLRFGDNWWFGSQGDFLLAINIEEPITYYRFSRGESKNL